MFHGSSVPDFCFVLNRNISMLVKQLLIFNFSSSENLPFIMSFWRNVSSCSRLSVTSCLKATISSSDSVQQNYISVSISQIIPILLFGFNHISVSLRLAILTGYFGLLLSDKEVTITRSWLCAKGSTMIGLSVGSFCVGPTTFMTVTEFAGIHTSALPATSETCNVAIVALLKCLYPGHHSLIFSQLL